MLMAPVQPENPYQRRLSEELTELGVSVRNVPPPGPGVPTLRLEVADFRPDVVHLHWLHPYFLASGALRSATRAARFLHELRHVLRGGTRLVWTAHNLVNHDGRLPFLDRVVTRRVSARAAAVVAHCEAARGALVAALGPRLAERTTIIPHGHYADDYPNAIAGAVAREELGIDRGPLVFLFLGRVRPYKGVFELLDAFAAADLPAGARLVVAGKASGERLRVRLKRRCGRRPGVDLHYGYVPSERVQVFMNAADVVVLPYRDALTSGAAVLAASFGKPIVAPALGCLAELLDREGAWLYDPADAEGLRASLEQAARDGDRYAAMGAHNRRRVVQWSWPVVARLHLDVYRRVTERA